VTLFTFYSRDDKGKPMKLGTVDTISGIITGDDKTIKMYIDSSRATIGNAKSIDRAFSGKSMVWAVITKPEKDAGITKNKISVKFTIKD